MGLNRPTNSGLAKAHNTQQGFTFIELVIVIVILGILSVTAAPRFMNLSSDAHAAALEGLKAAMSTAIIQVEAKAMVRGDYNVTRFIRVNYSGIDIKIANKGSLTVAWEDGFKHLLDGNFTHIGTGSSEFATVCQHDDFCVIDNFTVSALVNSGVGLGILFLPKGYAANDNCFAYYYRELHTSTSELEEHGVKTITSGC